MCGGGGGVNRRNLPLRRVHTGGVHRAVKVSQHVFDVEHQLGEPGVLREGFEELLAMQQRVHNLPGRGTTATRTNQLDRVCVCVYSFASTSTKALLRLRYKHGKEYENMKKHV